MLGGRQILRGIDLTIEEGETFVLLGRSGSGKTTLLRLINRMAEASAGSVRVFGRPDHNPVLLRRSIGYVIQDGGLFPHWTVGRNIALVPTLEGWPTEKIEARTSQLMLTMGLDPDIYRSRYPRQLSGGERQRVGIARALAADPPLLLLDEPFSALDPITRFELQQHFLALRNVLRKTAVFVTHDVREALTLGSRIGLLADGKLAAVAPPDEFRGLDIAEARRFLQTVE
ncbi:MAG TPA: ATP-binding cassette domain-containing protein [Bryobacteraceae bacterium]|nr:ATP-binding cassette domain-containing protein [Bryobacteraceae bacterium]